MSLDMPGHDLILGTLIIRIVFRGPLYCNEEPPK